MFSRLKGRGIVITIFVGISIYCYELALNDALVIRPILTEIKEVTDKIKVSGNETYIIQGMEILHEKKGEIRINSDSMYTAFTYIYLLCWFNLMFFSAHVKQMIFLRKLDRVYPFPTIGFFTDLILFVLSVYTINWIQKNIRKGIDDTNREEE